MKFLNFLLGIAYPKPAIPDRLSVRLEANERIVGFVKLDQTRGILNEPYRLTHLIAEGDLL